MSEDWTAAEYERRKRRFVEGRLFHRSVYLHASLIFIGTFLTGWVCSWALLTLGVRSMPLRYAISFVGSYAVFLLLVRLWAGFMHKDRDEGLGWGDAVDGADLASADAEGCIVVLVV